MHQMLYIVISVIIVLFHPHQMQKKLSITKESVTPSFSSTTLPMVYFSRFDRNPTVFHSSITINGNHHDHRDKSDDELPL